MTFSVAVCLALAGASVALVALRSHRDEVSDTRLATESSEQRELRDGWRELGTLAASYPPVVPTNAAPPAAPAPEAPAAPPPEVPSASGAATPAAPSARAPVASSAATPAAAGGSLGGNAGNGGTGAGGSGGNAAPPEPSENLQSTLPVAPPMLNFSTQSALCGPNTCNLGEVCCNASCGICVAPGATCDQTRCDNAIQYPASQACGLTTCNIDSVCCNPSCGICVAPGDECSQRACG